MKDNKAKLNKLKVKKRSIEKMLDRINNKIEKIMLKICESCEHDFERDGHGHNDDHYTCRKCHFGKFE